MRVLIRERAAGSAGSYHDRELEVPQLSFGSAPDCALQVIGRGVARHHGTLQASGEGLVVRCAAGRTVQVGDADVGRATLGPGESLELAGTRIEARPPPAGFDAAVAVTPARDVDPEDFSAAYVTGLEETWLSRRKAAWIFTAVILTVGLALPWLVPRDAVPWWTSDEVWSSGPLHQAHAVAIGDDCGACHVQPFQRVQDQQCVTCHTSMADHTPPPLASHVGLETTRCASCHKEHNEPVHITITADALCTDCHTEPDWPDNRLAGIGGFTTSDHPAFQADLRKSTATRRGTGLRYDWRIEATPLPQAEDQSNLKFPHDVHLDAEQVQDPTSGEGLACAACHTLQADDEHFAPITMERHCRDCHDLKFDRQAPDRELPHGDPAEVLLTMEGHYMRLYGDPEAGTPDRPRRRLPDRAAAAAGCDGPAYLCARERTAREAETQFTRRGCVTCHEVAVHDSDDLLGRYQVVPVRLTQDFFRVARFDHRAHLTQRDASGDAACGECHDAATSAVSQDVLIPDIEQCVACHGDHRQKELVPLHCIDCHAFHPRGGGEST